MILRSVPQGGAYYSAVVSDLLDMESLDEATGLQPISIRIQKSILHDLKLIAKLHGMGYQSLIKNLLKRFVISEAKRFLREHAPALTEESFVADCTDDQVEGEPRKTA